MEIYNHVVALQAEEPSEEEDDLSLMAEDEATEPDDDEFDFEQEEEPESVEFEEVTSEETISEDNSSDGTADPIVTEEQPEPSSEPEITYTYSDMDKTVYASLNLNVRSGPSTAFGVIGAYSTNGEIAVTGVCNETGWYRVNFDGTEGFCDANYTIDTITSAQPSNETTANTDSGSADNGSNGNGNSTSTVSYGVVSAGDGGASSYYVGLIQNAFNSLPQWVQTAFVNNGWSIQARSGSWWGEFGWNMQLKGLTVSDYRTVYISARDDSANYHTVAHEVGHFVDWLYGWVSHSAEFNGIYNSEYRQFCNYYSYSNGAPGAEELFAEGLYHYWTDPGVLVSVAPNTYNYINRVLG